MTARGALSESQRGILLSSMSDATAGSVLGRSASWVARMRAALNDPAPAAEPEAPPAPIDYAGTSKLALKGAALALRHPADAVFGSGTTARRVRILAAQAMQRRGWGSSRMLAEGFCIHSTELSPSMLFRAGIGVEVIVGLAQTLPAAPKVEPAPKPITPKHPPRVMPAVLTPKPLKPKPAPPSSAGGSGTPKVRHGRVFAGVVHDLWLDRDGRRRITLQLNSDLRVRTWLSSDADHALKVGARAELVYDADVWLVGAAA